MNAADERAIALSHMLGKRPETKWRTFGTGAQIVFFIFTSLGVLALFLLCDELKWPKGWITAIVSIAIAEYLMRRQRFAATGVESALWLGGLDAFIFGLPGEGKIEVLLLFAVACATAGLRVRNALITTAAIVFVIAYLNTKQGWAAALLTSVAIVAIAAALMTREWQRPSTEMLLVVVMLVVPIAGVWDTFGEAQLAAIPFYAALAALELYVGIRHRLRAPLIASAVPIALAFISARELFHWLDIEWKLMLAGVSLFALSVAISRALHDKKTGFVMTPVKSRIEDTLQVFGSALLAPHAQKNSSPESIGGGGSFGGGGSSGDF